MDKQKTGVFYKTMSKFYDLLDIIRFRNYNNSPRKAVLETIENGESVLGLCTGTATNRHMGKRWMSRWRWKE